MPVFYAADDGPQLHALVELYAAIYGADEGGDAHDGIFLDRRGDEKPLHFIKLWAAD